MKKVIDSIGIAVEKLGNAFDDNFTSKEEVLKEVTKAQNHLLDTKKSILLAEAKGTKMQRNWRPFLMYEFGIIIGYNTIIAPILAHFWNIPKPALTPDFWEVLKLAIGGYVIGRTGEKVLPGVTETIKKVVQTRKERRQNRKDEQQN